MWREGSACVRRWRLEDAYGGKFEEVVSQLILDSPEEADNCLTGSTPFSIDINHCKEEGGRKPLTHLKSHSLSASHATVFLACSMRGWNKAAIYIGFFFFFFVHTIK